jgi:HD superfamily phosphodiesterase
MGQADWARDLARKLLEEPLPRRWAHTQGVATQAESLAPILGDDTDLVTAAAWLHDVGYSPSLVDTGFHPLDGARYLRDVECADGMLCRLVGHHSCAIIEAEERGLADNLSREFEPVRQDLADALIYCDMITGPNGERVSVEKRLAEVEARYGPSHLVTLSIVRARPRLIAAVRSVEISFMSDYRLISQR